MRSTIDASRERGQGRYAGLRRVTGLNCRVFFHDRCFDGACSAALFTEFHRWVTEGAASYEYRGLSHRAGPMFEEGWTDPVGENAIVDFKYSPLPEITWWFDHHLSSFMTADDERHFRDGQVGPDGGPGPRTGRQFFDASYPSCTGWIAHVAETRFGMEMGPYRSLVRWADEVDGARFPSAAAVVGMTEPAYRLMTTIENAPSSEFVVRVIPLLTRMGLGEVLEQDFVKEAVGPVMEGHWRQVELLRERVQMERGVVTLDLADVPGDGYNKFIPYYLLPEAVYTVGLSRGSKRIKISVGTNPWTTAAPEHLANIAAICERYGGGGHARVGAISFATDRLEEAREAAAVIAEELRGR